MAEQTAAQKQSGEGSSEHVMARVREALMGLRYGEVTLVVQDGVLVQIERTEKVRLRTSGMG